jgi:hypothetical protein
LKMQLIYKYLLIVRVIRYWDTLLEMFWPRFTGIVEMNIESVQGTDPQRLGNIDIRPHYVRTC